MESQITHVIFDMDGLLLDTETRYTKATLNLTQRYGKDYPFELKKKIMGRGSREVAEIITADLELPITPDEYIEMIGQEYEKVFSEYIPAMPGAERLVRHLASHSIPIAVCTSSKAETYHLKTAPHRELFSLFNHIVIASQDPEITRSKPDPQPFLVCASRFAQKPANMDQVLVFEDSVAGVEAANAAGMKSIWVPDSRMDRNAVAAFQVLESLEKFCPQLFGLPSFN